MTFPVSKRFYSLALGLLLSGSIFSVQPMSAFACSGNPDSSHGNPPKFGTITTQGHGEVKVHPDSLSVSITASTQKPTLSEARSENNKKAQAIIKALKGLNMPSLMLESRNISVYPVYEQRERDNKLPKLIGYTVTHNLQAKVVKVTPEQLGEAGSKILDTALNAGATQAGGLDFFIEDMSLPRSQALELAVKDAKNNADAMARAGNVTLTGLMTLDGAPQFGGFPRPVMMRANFKGAAAAAPEMADTPVEAGEVTVTSDVTAKFKF